MIMFVNTIERTQTRRKYATAETDLLIEAM